jgi:large subunit ribosomal protein L17
MRHRIAGSSLGRDSEHRIALRRNLAASLFESETVSTTIQKAKEVKSFSEKLITLAKKGTLAARRRAIALLGNRTIVKNEEGKIVKVSTVIGKLFSDIAPRYLDRKGGYTRIIKLAKTRLGDNGQLVLLQLVGKEHEPKKSEASAAKKSRAKKEKTSEKALEPAAAKVESTDKPAQTSEKPKPS